MNQACKQRNLFRFSKGSKPIPRGHRAYKLFYTLQKHILLCFMSCFPTSANEFYVSRQRRLQCQQAQNHSWAAFFCIVYLYLVYLILICDRYYRWRLSRVWLGPTKRFKECPRFNLFNAVPMKGIITKIEHSILVPRRVWRHQRGNQNLYIEEQTTQWAKEKVQKEKQRSTKHTYKTKDRTTRIPLITKGELRCSGRVGSSCSTSGTRRGNLITHIL